VEFRYAPTEENSANLPSRSSSLVDLKTSICWTGPSWLNKTENWPLNEYKFHDSFQCEPQVFFASAPIFRPPFQVNLEKFSDLMKPLWVTANCAVYLGNLATRINSTAFQFSNRLIMHAQLLWIKAEQEYHYHDVIGALC